MRSDGPETLPQTFATTVNAALRGLTPGGLLGLITTQQGAIECADENKRHIDAARSNGKIWN